MHTYPNPAASARRDNFQARRGWKPAVIGTLLLASTMLGWIAVAQAASGTTLNGISYSVLPGDRVRIRLELSAPVKAPLSFAIDNPARVALDFPGVSINLPRKTQSVGVGMARSVTAVEAAGRTRVVLNLVKLVPYQTKVQGSSVFITIASAAGAAKTALAPAAAVGGQRGTIENIDFRRGDKGEGRILITLSNPSTVVNSFEEGGKIIVEFLNSTLPERLSRLLNVVDFATPVTTVDTRQQGGMVRMVVATKGLFENIAYQSDNLFTIEVKPITKEAEKAAKKKKFGYTGERLSLNFQNIEVRAILQLIADFTGLNLVASDTVSGNLTLRLKNVPWDQALDIILKSKGLAMRQAGNVIMVAPSEEIAAREKLDLEAEKQITELAPLRSEFIQINYAKAGDIATLLKAKENSLLTARGNVAVDARTNTLLVRDTEKALGEVRKLVAKLDIPVRQVLIESRIVIADDKFSRDLGVRFGVSRNVDVGNSPNRLVVGGTRPGNTNFNGTVAFNTGGNEDLLVDLPIGAPAGSLGIALVAIPNTLLQLELQAMQSEGRGEVVSNPRVITSNQKEATIEQGTEIPFQEASSSGATSTSFKKAVLSLKVTPQITPDNRIIMDLEVNKDSVGAVTVQGTPTIDTQALNTQVLVNNGETVVLGGIFEQTKRKDATKVPFLGDLPYFGLLFRTTKVRNDKTELLIFVTPKILTDTATGG